MSEEEFVEKMKELYEMGSRWREGMWEEKLRDAFRWERSVMLPLPPFPKEVDITVTLDKSILPPPLLRRALLDAIDEIAAIVLSTPYKGRPVLYVGLGRVFQRSKEIYTECTIVLSPRTPTREFIAAAMLHKILSSEHEIDIFTILEEVLEAPGAFDALRKKIEKANIIIETWPLFPA